MGWCENSKAGSVGPWQYSGYKIDGLHPLPCSNRPPSRGQVSTRAHAALRMIAQPANLLYERPAFANIAAATLKAVDFPVSRAFAAQIVSGRH
jgi:hypothetical protein